MGHIKRVLIIAPTSVVAVWPSEFQSYADFRYTCRTLLGTKASRLAELDSLTRYPYPDLKVACINYESTWRDGIFEALLDYDADLIICDESQRIKTHDAAQSKAIHQLGDKARYKMILSGTPVQNDAMDIYSQYRFLDKSIFGINFDFPVKSPRRQTSHPPNGIRPLQNHGFFRPIPKQYAPFYLLFRQKGQTPPFDAADGRITQSNWMLRSSP